jgi:tetratricopeptide (TPR) repeat protein
VSEIERQLERARLALKSGRHDEVQAACQEVLKSAPENGPAAGEAYFLVGVCAYEQNALAPSVELFRRAVNADPTKPEYFMRLAASLVTLNLQAQALEAADQAAAFDPKDALTLDSLGVIYSRIGAYDQAYALFKRAVEIEPANTGYLYNLGYGAQYLGDLDAARAAYKRILALDPNFERAYLAWVEITPQVREANYTKVLIDLFQNAWNSAERRLAIGHALAKTYEDIGEYDEAMDWLERAKSGWLKASGYSFAKDQEIFAAAWDTVTEAATPTGGFSSEEPIFVVGLPRTGTTLVERILSSHPEVTSAGELMNFPMLVKRGTGTTTPTLMDPETLEAATKLDFTGLGAAYVKSTRPMTGVTARFIDKLPFNFLYAGLIHRALPQAKIVCLKREPMDAVLSNYRQMFQAQSPFHGYSFDLEDIARYVAAFEILVEHWRQVLPQDWFLEVGYEALVAHQEAQTRRLVAFCGLDWDTRTLNFHENSAGVATASSAQVRAPMYGTSVGRWKKYGDRLKGVEGILAEASVSLKA